MSLVIHQSGIDAAISAKAEGFSGAQLKYVDLFNGSSKIKRLELAGVQLIEPGRIYVAATDSSKNAYDVTKMQFITSTGALFATAQHDDGSVIQSKAAKSTLMLAHQLNISTVPGTVAPSGNVSVFAPQATEDMLGTAEIAEQTEVDAGTDDTRFVTPKKLLKWLNNRLSSSISSDSTTTPANSKSVKTAMDRANLARAEGTRQATTGGKGQAEIATQTEANAGVDNERIITPRTLKSRLLSFARSATESVKGFIEIATQSETDAGLDDARAVTPKKLKSWWSSVNTDFKSAAYLDAGQNVGQVAKIGNPSVPGNTAVVIAVGTNANGSYRIYSNGEVEMWGTSQNWNYELGDFFYCTIDFPVQLPGNHARAVMTHDWVGWNNNAVGESLGHDKYSSTFFRVFVNKRLTGNIKPVNSVDWRVICIP